MKRIGLLLAALLFFSSCSKKPESQGGAAQGAAGLLNNALLDALPVGTVLFYTWDSSSPAYERYQKSPWGKDPIGMLDKIQAQQPDAASEEIETLKEVIKASGVLGTDGKPADAALGAAFLTVKGDQPVGGVYLAAKSGADMTRQLAALRGVLTARKMTVEDAAVGGKQGFAASKPGVPVKLYFAATPEKLGVASDPELVAPLFAGEAAGGYQALKQLPTYEKLVQNVMGKPDTISAAFVDVAGLLAAAQRSQPDKANDIKNVPIEAGAFSRQMGDGLHDDFALSLVSKDPLQAELLKSLAPRSGGVVLDSVPQDMVLLLTVDGAVLSRIKQTAEAQPGQVDSFKQQLALIDSIQSLSVGIRNPAPGSPFPELLVMAESKDAAAFSSALKALIGGAFGAAMPVQWQQKDVGGVQASSIFTPIGVEVLLGNTKNAVLLTSAQTIFRDTVAGKQPLMKALPDATVRSIKSQAPAAMGYLAFDRLGALLEGLQSTLAMFTGGKSSLDLNQIEQIKQLGRVAFTVQLTDQMLKVSTDYSQTPESR